MNSTSAESQNSQTSRSVITAPATAAIFHHIDLIFSVILTISLFSSEQTALACVALILLILERLAQVTHILNIFNYSILSFHFYSIVAILNVFVIYLNCPPLIHIITSCLKLNEQFIQRGITTYKWSQALMSLVFLDYILDMCVSPSSEESASGKAYRLFKKSYMHALIISSPFAMLSFFAYFATSQLSGLILICGFVHALSAAHTNALYYALNLPSVTPKQQAYIFAFIFCECYFRLVLLSLFRELSGDGGISLYLIIAFVIYAIIDFLISKRALAERSVYLRSLLKKAWTSVFYFRLEDTMVQDVDEWTESTRCVENKPQEEGITGKSFKSPRSKVFIGVRLFENLLLTILGIIQLANTDQPQEITLFVFAMILLPFYLLWHIKYVIFRFQSSLEQQNDHSVNHTDEPVQVENLKKENKNNNNNNNSKKKYEDMSPATAAENLGQNKNDRFGSGETRTPGSDKADNNNRQKNSGGLAAAVAAQGPGNQGGFYTSTAIVAGSGRFSHHQKSQSSQQVGGAAAAAAAAAGLSFETKNRRTMVETPEKDQGQANGIMTPVSNGIQISENTQFGGSDSKHVDERKPFSHRNKASQDLSRNKSTLNNNNYSRNLYTAEDAQMKYQQQADEESENNPNMSNSKQKQSQQLPSKLFTGQYVSNGSNNSSTSNNNKNQEDDEDDPYGSGEVNAFAIE